MFKHILIPTDGSKRSDAAAAAGVKLARALGARVSGLFVAPAATPLVYRGLLPVGFSTPRKNAALIEKAADRYLQVIERAARAARVPCECIRITSDFPAETILQVAAKRKCDLIVMASHGRRGVAGVLLGSETQKVLSGTKLQVLVYR